jgi:hypothetical protein
MPTAGKFCTHSSHRAYHGFPLVTRLFFGANLTPPFTRSGWELEKTVILPIRQVVRRWSIRGFKDDYYHVDTDVVLMEGELHSGRKPVSISLHFALTHSHMMVNINSDINSLFC